jgi:hypothetical protein
MADNVTLPGTGAVVATDEVAGRQYQLVKLAVGGDGVAVQADASNPIPVGVQSLPLPAGAATETTLAAVSAKLPALSGGRIPVELPAGGSGLTDAELRAEAVPVTDGAAGSLLWRILQVLLSPLGYDKSLQRQRGTVIVESGTVSVVTNVTTLTNLNNLDGYNARMLVLGQNQAAWQACVRARIT